MTRTLLTVLSALAMAAALACTRNAVEKATPASAPAVPADPPAAPSASHPVQIEMKNVNLHMDEGIVLRVAYLRGEMVSTRPAQSPVFDDQRSYLLRLSKADVTMDVASLANLMTHHIFGYESAPLKDISVETEGGRLVQKGKLDKAVDVPFTMKASVEATPDGRMRLHTESVSTLGVPAKKLMAIFGLSLEDVVNIKERRGVEIAEDDIIIAPGRVLPPPEIQGHLAKVEVVDGALHQVFETAGRGSGGRLAPADAPSANYVYFSGSTIRFGKLLMTGADLLIADADPKDAFDFYPAKYQQQLVAGYSKNTPSGGLRTFMPDFNDLTRTATRR